MKLLELGNLMNYLLMNNQLDHFIANIHFVPKIKHIFAKEISKHGL